MATLPPQPTSRLSVYKHPERRGRGPRELFPVCPSETPVPRLWQSWEWHTTTFYVCHTLTLTGCIDPAPCRWLG